MVSNKTIFIAPLDWGLGHATRCVSLIKQLLEQNKIYIGVTQNNKDFFQKQFPQIPQIQLPAYNIRYHRFLPVWFKILIDWPRIQRVINIEHKLLQTIIKDHLIDFVISDNRFGLFTKNTHSVFITNQMFVKTPFLNKIAQAVNASYIKRFDEVWVPDYADKKLSLTGSLNHGKHFHANVKFIGPLTRLKKILYPIHTFDVLVLLSGPQPQHAIFMEQIKKWAALNQHLQFVFVSALVQIQSEKNVTGFYQPDENQLSDLICGSKVVICRSGYSSLMDLHSLGKQKLYLCATVGQTEQIYLAKYWQDKFSAKIINPDKPEGIQI